MHVKAPWAAHSWHTSSQAKNGTCNHHPGLTESALKLSSPSVSPVVVETTTAFLHSSLFLLQTQSLLSSGGAVDLPHLIPGLFLILLSSTFLHLFFSYFPPLSLSHQTWVHMLLLLGIFSAIGFFSLIFRFF